jgi:hypothetical protein
MVRRAIRFLKLGLWRLFPEIYDRFTAAAKTQFAIGIYSGASPFEMKPAAGVSNPVLSRKRITEIPAGTVADPFMIKVRGSWYMFFELTNQIRHKGEIALATSKDALDWRFEQIVLAEPFHMSYPYVFEWEGEIFMIPETGRARSVRLYKARQFPKNWQHVATLLEMICGGCSQMPVLTPVHRCCGCTSPANSLVHGQSTRKAPWRAVTHISRDRVAASL